MTEPYTVTPHITITTGITTITNDAEETTITTDREAPTTTVEEYTTTDDEALTTTEDEPLTSSDQPMETYQWVGHRIPFVGMYPTTVLPNTPGEITLLI